MDSKDDTIAALTRIHAMKCETEVALFDDLLAHFANADAAGALNHLLDWADSHDILGAATPPEVWPLITTAQRAYPMSDRPGTNG